MTSRVLSGSISSITASSSSTHVRTSCARVASSRPVGLRPPGGPGCPQGSKNNEHNKSLTNYGIVVGFLRSGF